MNISDELLKTIEIMVKSEIDKLNFDRTYTGIISSVNNDGYTVKYNGTEINIKSKNTSIYKKYDKVKFCVPCNNKEKAYMVVDIDVINTLLSS